MKHSYYISDKGILISNTLLVVDVHFGIDF